ncbi:hypothetical protein [Oceanibaculum indicum]|uniref:hypothetical protein n=1 Tax=Oceanibaculum indicum TaxID=526216 RepID=UPI0011C39F55|nr:hypothetical protein [Oceanibaculum indicum]
MSFVPPTSPVGVAGTAPAATVGTLVNAPESLKAADPGTVVKGTVEGRDKQGNLIVRTEQGAVALRTAANFRPGTALTMEVRAVGDSQQVVILSVDRRAAPTQQPTQQPLPQQPAQPAQPPAQQAGQQVGQQPAAQTPSVPAQGAGQAQGGTPAQPASPAGTPQTGTATPAPQQGTPQPAAQQPAVSVASSPVIAASTQPPQPLQAGQTVQALLVQTLTGQAQGQAQGQTIPGAPPTTPTQAAPAQATPPQAALPQGTQAAAGTPPAPSSTMPATTPANTTIPTTGTPAIGTPTPASAPTPATPPASTPLPTQAGGTAPSAPTAAAPAAPAATPQAAAQSAGAPAAAGPTPPPAGQPVQTPALPPSLTAPATSASLTALPAGAPAAQILQALPAGSTIAVTVNAIQQPAQAAPQSSPQGPTAQGAVQGAAAGQVTQAGQATAGQAPAAQPPGLQPLPTGGATITATVVGSTAAGQPLLQTSFGLVTIPGAQGLPVGTGVTLGLSPSALGNAEATARAALGLPPGNASGTAAAGGQPASLGRAWPALNEAFVQLSQTNPALAQTLLQTAIPQPGPQLAGALLFFMAALRGGDVRSWMGDQTARALGGRDGRSPLLSRLSDDMGQMTRTGTDAAGNEWRGFYIPLFDGRDLQQIRLFMRDPTEEGDGNAEGGSGHRFLIDLDLSKLGALQLDGLARTERLDLIVRTHRALPRDIKAEIVRLFEETAERVGLKGQVSFQATPHFPPLPFVEHNEIIEVHSEIEA